MNFFAVFRSILYIAGSIRSYIRTFHTSNTTTDLFDLRIRGETDTIDPLPLKVWKERPVRVNVHGERHAVSPFREDARRLEFVLEDQIREMDRKVAEFGFREKEDLRFYEEAFVCRQKKRYIYLPDNNQTPKIYFPTGWVINKTITSVTPPSWKRVVSSSNLFITSTVKDKKFVQSFLTQIWTNFIPIKKTHCLSHKWS